MSNDALSAAPHSRIVTLPNALTLLRLLLVPVFVIASLESEFLVAFCALVSAGITDIFDGYIARRLNQHSRLGALLDPAADKTMMISGYVLYTLLPRAEYRLPLWLTFTVFMRDFLIVLFVYLLYTRIRVSRFPPSWPGKLSTLCQIVALCATVGANTELVAPVARPCWLPSLVLALLATLFSGFDYLRRWNEIVLSSE